MNKIESKMIFGTIKKVLIPVLALALVIGAAACAASSSDDEEKEETKQEQYKPNSVLGIAESYVGKDVTGLIEDVGTLKGDPHIKPTNDGGGYEGLYEFDGFTVVTYAKSVNSENLVTEIIPDKESKVYKDSLDTEPGGTK